MARAVFFEGSLLLIFDRLQPVPRDSNDSGYGGRFVKIV